MSPVPLLLCTRHVTDLAHPTPATPSKHSSTAAGMSSCGSWPAQDERGCICAPNIGACCCCQAALLSQQLEPFTIPQPPPRPCSLGCQSLQALHRHTHTHPARCQQQAAASSRQQAAGHRPASQPHTHAPAALAMSITAAVDITWRAQHHACPSHPVAPACEWVQPTSCPKHIFHWMSSILPAAACAAPSIKAAPASPCAPARGRSLASTETSIKHPASQALHSSSGAGQGKPYSLYETARSVPASAGTHHRCIVTLNERALCDDLVLYAHPQSAAAALQSCMRGEHTCMASAGPSRSAPSSCLPPQPAMCAQWHNPLENN
jgi:hypothetical protein